MNDVVVTRTPDGQIVAVTRQDDEGRILEVIAEAPERQPVQPDQEVARYLGAAFEEMLKMHPANQRWNDQATENDPDPLPQERYLGFDQEAGNIRGYTESDMRTYAVRFAQRRMLTDQPVQPLAWSAAPNTITFAGGEMVIAEVAIDRNNTLTMYCDADQAHKVPDALAALAVARQPVPPLSDEQIDAIYRQFGTARPDGFLAAARAVERLVIERMGK